MGSQIWFLKLKSMFIHLHWLISLDEILPPNRQITSIENQHYYHMPCSLKLNLDIIAIQNTKDNFSKGSYAESFKKGKSIQEY